MSFFGRIVGRLLGKGEAVADTGQRSSAQVPSDSREESSLAKDAESYVVLPVWVRERILAESSPWGHERCGGCGEEFMRTRAFLEIAKKLELEGIGAEGTDGRSPDEIEEVYTAIFGWQFPPEKQAVICPGCLQAERFALNQWMGMGTSFLEDVPTKDMIAAFVRGGMPSESDSAPAPDRHVHAKEQAETLRHAIVGIESITEVTLMRGAGAASADDLLSGSLPPPLQDVLDSVRRTARLSRRLSSVLASEGGNDQEESASELASMALNSLDEIEEHARRANFEFKSMARMDLENIRAVARDLGS